MLPLSRKSYILNFIRVYQINDMKKRTEFKAKYLRLDYTVTVLISVSKVI